jgi:hypothetical protein
MAVLTTAITKNSLSFAGGVAGVSGRGKKVIIEINGTVEVGDKFNVTLGERNFGFVKKPIGEVTALVTLKTKIFAAAGTILYFSGIATPTRWEPDADVGAGFRNMANEYSGAEPLTGLGVYQENLAIFSRWAVQIWYVDPDPVGDRQVQVLDNVGCLAPKSVVSVGDLDVFFLSDTGLRSLRARDSSNAAFISDVGTPIDPEIIATLRGLSEEEKRAAVAVIEPEDGRYWLQVGDRIFAFSFFQGAKISAWSTYAPPSPAGWLTVLNGRVYARLEDNTLSQYGGADNATYDDSQVEAITPFMDARAPATWKNLEGIDIGAQGEWQVDICTDPLNPDVYERLCQLSGPSYTLRRITVAGDTTHFKLRLRSIGDGYARLSNIAVHYRSHEAG